MELTRELQEELMRLKALAESFRDEKLYGMIDALQITVFRLEEVYYGI